MTPGRPTVFDAELAAAVLECLAEGLLLAEICEFPGFPKESTVRGWALDDREGFAAPYARARRLGWERQAERILIIADTPVEGQIITDSPKDGRSVKTADMIEHRRLQVDTRKWLLGKVLPRIYGDKLQVETTEGTKSPQEHTDAELAAIAAQGAPKA